MLDQTTVAVIKSTIPLLESAGPALTQHFYQRMFSHNPELKDIFNLAHQRSGGQPLALFNAVAAYAKNIDNLGGTRRCGRADCAQTYRIPDPA